MSTVREAIDDDDEEEDDCDCDAEEDENCPCCMPPPLPPPLVREPAPPVMTAIELVIDFFAWVLEEVPLMFELNFESELEREWAWELASSIP